MPRARGKRSHPPHLPTSVASEAELCLGHRMLCCPEIFPEQQGCEAFRLKDDAQGCRHGQHLILYASVSPSVEGAKNSFLLVL